MNARHGNLIIALTLLGLAACLPQPLLEQPAPTQPAVSVPANPSSDQPTPLPQRLPIVPGQIMDYPAQSGDTLPAVAADFNTTVDAVRAANSWLPRDVTTLAPGKDLRVPAYFAPFTGTSFKILPDSEVVNSPGLAGFNLQAVVEEKAGYLSRYQAYAFDSTRPGWDIVQVVAQTYSLSPRLLLALLQFRSGWLTNPSPTQGEIDYPLGFHDPVWKGLAQQLTWAAEQLNNGYYGWRIGSLTQIQLADGRVTRPDPYQNAGTVAVQFLLAQYFGQDQFDQAVGPQGFVQTYRSLFGDPFSKAVTLMAGSLRQPTLSLPFEPGHFWAFTGAPHPAWGDSLPWGALDFAPPSTIKGCADSEEWVVAPAGGIVARSEPATVILDLDGDGDERTGWVVLFYHIADQDRVPQGTVLKEGDRIGHPSCEGGRATGDNVHMARRYNGEWIPASGPLAFDLSDWVAASGGTPYLGTLTRGLVTMSACSCTVFSNELALPGP